MTESVYQRYGEGKEVFIFLNHKGEIRPEECFKKQIGENRITLVDIPVRAEENIFNYDRPPEDRLWALEGFQEEVIRAIPEKTLPYLLGADVAGYMGANFFFKRPDLFRGGIFLSGFYRLNHFMGDYMSEKAYLNSPVDFLPGLESAEAFKAFLRSRLIFCVGRGEGEEAARSALEEFDRILQRRSIPAFVNIEGYESRHNPDAWSRQFKEMAEIILK